MKYYYDYDKLKGQYDKLTKRQKNILKHFACIGQTTGDWNNYWAYKHMFLNMNKDKDKDN